MAQDITDHSRVQDLKKGLAAYQGARAPVMRVPSQQDLFVRHQDGAVYDRQGNLVREAPPPAGK